VKEEVKKATINDVARIAEVSKKTVSRIINQSSGVSQKTRDHVLAVIKELEYSPDPQARGLASKRSYILGLAYDNPNASFVSNVQQGVLSRCRERGYELVVHPCDMHSKSMIKEIKHFVERLKLDGIVLLPPLSESNELIEMLKASSCQYVRILSVSLDQPEHIVVSSDRQAVKEIADYLLDLGHKRIGCILGPKGHKSALERFEGFRDALAEGGITLDEKMLAQGSYTFESGLVGADQLLAHSIKPTAIFASNDAMAMGAMVAASRRGIEVPSELSIIGFDDEPHASRIATALTTVNQQAIKMGQLAAEKLVFLCNKDSGQASAIQSLVVPKLVIRQSSCVVKT
jgi:LacI family transcriptional regulator